MKSRTVRRFVSLTLAVLLLTAEIFALTHRLDAAAHSGADPCKICLSVGSFDAADVADHAPVAIAVAKPSTPIWYSSAFVLSRREAPVARGPPVLS